MKSTKTPNLSNITQKWVGLLIPFTQNYKAKLSASELARKTKIPQQTASRYLDNLVSRNLLQYERQGRNKLFYFDLEKQTTKILLTIIENQKTLSFEFEIDSSTVINEILKECESLIIFGSYAARTFDKDSDLDILILGKSNKKSIKLIKDRQTLEINEYYSSYSEFSESIKKRNHLAVEIMKDHLIFGDTSKIIEIFLRSML